MVIELVFLHKYMNILVEVSKISGIPSPLQIILTEIVLNSKEFNLKLIYCTHIIR